ncbi:MULTISPECIES: efflux transporter outer membrane subunit [unclassified Variovorax]|uniref:efflux transporter outer membrane subunit n=2 Tax=Variovorax TaxID=34072 RepID=UPI000C9C0204|nr:MULTISPECIES: efflux transporter outer membrane subunit [unclassified Variovorax]PNG52012.1 Toluene efflux pump outer membrane protein TtgF [Variovorax sp. B4]PNG54552.1 Toluene efflux pump outer membrane protein TtgF [Variovorax sp. B2]VTV15518.1 Multidrug resistance outer membrane protein MdtP precursor [Variovorax sp. WDL1]
MIPLLPETARRPVAALAFAVALFLAGCADMGRIDSHASLRDAASIGLTPEAAAMATPTVGSQWWLGFGDGQLNALVDQALQGNPDLQVARARLERAQAAIGAAEAGRLPKVDGQLDLTKQKFSSNYIYPAPLGGSRQELGTLQLNASWELDFFGRNRTAIEAAVGSTNAAAADADAARVLLASNVARAYVQWARLDDQLAVARRTLSQREETLRLVRDRVSAGLDTRLEQFQSEGGLPQARQQIEALNEQIAFARNALDALVGQPGATRTLAPPKIDGLRPIALQPTIPADLLGRRADVAAARWRVEAATSDVANAKTQFYPNVNLVAFAGFSALGFGQITKSGSEQWSVGPAVRLPIFEGGRLRANLRGRMADLDAAIESYNAAVLDAVRDVADQVASAQSVARQQAEQAASQRAAESAYDIAVQRYGAGLGNYLNVLTAETTVLAERRQAVDLAARALETQVGLARALGGGWQPPVQATADASQRAPRHP